MRPLATVLLVSLALVAPSGAAAPVEGGGSFAPINSGASASGAARIVSVYPDPVATGDRGEHAVLSLPETANWTLTDGEARIHLPRNATGRVVVGPHPAAIQSLTDLSVVSAAGLALANDGERLRLLRDGSVVDEVAYDSAPEGERWVRDADPPWRPRGYDPRSVVESTADRATAFVLPDAPEVPLRTLRDAQRRVLLGGYTFTSRRVANVLVAAARRGVTVRVLLEREPVGGVSRREAEVLDRLVAAGVEVRLLGGEHARFSYHHAKYAVVDDRALVLTENWKPAGTGGRSSRGWGVRVDSAETAEDLATVFRTDAGWHDADE